MKGAKSIAEYVIRKWLEDRYGDKMNIFHTTVRHMKLIWRNDRCICRSKTYVKSCVT